MESLEVIEKKIVAFNNDLSLRGSKQIVSDIPGSEVCAKMVDNSKAFVVFGPLIEILLIRIAVRIQPIEAPIDAILAPRA